MLGLHDETERPLGAATPEVQIRESEQGRLHFRITARRATVRLCASAREDKHTNEHASQGLGSGDLGKSKGGTAARLIEKASKSTNPAALQSMGGCTVAAA